MTTRGFVLGKFMPPHAGHVALCRAAESLCDELTILVCWLPGDPIPGEQRLRWMRELFPHARVVGQDAEVPQHPDDSPDFWPIWRALVRAAHPQPIDMVFAGEMYGAELARQVGGRFVPLLREEAGISGTLAREDMAANWHHLPTPVRRDTAKVVVLHGIESTGKSVMTRALAEKLGTHWVPEYGRFHCEAYGTDLAPPDLTLIAAAQQAMILAARERSGPVLLSDTDWLMTRAWNRMLFGKELAGGSYPLADLYLHLAPDVPFVDDGLRMFGTADERSRFDALCRAELEAAGANRADISGSWEERLDRALAAIAALA